MFVEPVEEPVEDLFSSDLALVAGVVALAFEGGFELDGGDEERAGLAVRFVVAVEFDGSDVRQLAKFTGGVP